MQFLKSVHDKTGKLESLQCPYTWNIASQKLSQHCWDLISDRIKIESLTWNIVVYKVLLAHMACVLFNDIKLCRKTLTECYIPLMDLFDKSCDITREYKVGIKHVVDSCWAHSLLHESGKSARQPPKDVMDFVKKITPFQAMNVRQKSVVLVMRGIIAGDGDMIERAIMLHPGEGQWHCELGLFLTATANGQSSLDPAVKMKQIRKSRQAFEFAMRLRRNEKCAHICNALLCLGTAQAWMRSVVLMKNFLATYPENIHVLLTAGNYFWQIDEPFRDLDLAESCYRKAITKAEDCIAVNAIFGRFLYSKGYVEEAEPLLLKGAPLNEDAREILEEIQLRRHFGLLEINTL